MDIPENRVDTMVAMEFAASFIPLTKSKARARTTMKIVRVSMTPAPQALLMTTFPRAWVKSVHASQASSSPS